MAYCSIFVGTICNLSRKFVFNILIHTNPEQQNQPFLGFHQTWIKARIQGSNQQHLHKPHQSVLYYKYLIYSFTFFPSERIINSLSSLRILLFLFPCPLMDRTSLSRAVKLPTTVCTVLEKKHQLSAIISVTKHLTPKSPT